MQSAEDEDMRGEYSFALLQLLYEGFPASELEVLLASRDEKLRRSGAWLASEIPRAAHGLLDALVKVLADPVQGVRYYAMEAIQLSTGSEDSDSRAAVFDLIADSDDRIAMKAMEIMSRSTKAQLESAIEFVQPILGGPLLWLVGVEGVGEAHDSERIARALHSEDAITRRVAAVAVLGMAERDLRLLEVAARSDDAAISRLAADELERQSRLRTHAETRQTLGAVVEVQSTPRTVQLGVAYRKGIIVGPVPSFPEVAQHRDGDAMPSDQLDVLVGARRITLSRSECVATGERVPLEALYYDGSSIRASAKFEFLDEGEEGYEPRA